VYALLNGEWRELSATGRHYYKLCVFRRGWAPTLMIDGITMHSTLEDPLKVAARKIRRARGRALECCTGLGYTTIYALRRGARRVMSVEVDESVLALAALNPYSRELWSASVDIIAGDCVDIVRTLRAELFDCIIHDPPRLSHATQKLYSEPLYREFHRVLKRGGELFHYVSLSGTKYRGLDPYRGVVERLRRVGFSVYRVDRGYGVYAVRL
jgi:predicted methyltransferase